MSNVTTEVSAASVFGGDVGSEATDALWVILSTFIIFTMQSGFGLLESGLVSSKSESNVMVKNTRDVCLGGISFWLVGYGLAFGPNSNSDTNKFSGNGHFVTEPDIATEGHIYTKFFFQLSFSTTATTIVSGAVAERIHLGAYMVFAFLNTGVVYVFPAHWMWGGGWLADLGAYDFAGCGVVHMSGGAAAFVAAAMLGPRHGRFGKDKKLYGMSSPTHVTLGTFFLWWGWIGFNCGSTFAMSGGLWKIAGKIAVITMNGSMAGGLSAVLMCFVLYHRLGFTIDIPQVATGILAGLVAITAAAPVIRPWEGLFIGFIGGFVANGVCALLNKLRIDDPVGCVGVHWAAGLWGMIATGLFAEEIPGYDFINEDGAFKGGSGKLLGCNLLAGLVITLWSGVCTAIIFTVLKFTIGIRMSLEDEFRSADEIPCSDGAEHDIFEDPAEKKTNNVLGKRGSVISGIIADSIPIEAIENGLAA